MFFDSDMPLFTSYHCGRCGCVALVLYNPWAGGQGWEIEDTLRSSTYRYLTVVAPV